MIEGQALEEFFLRWGLRGADSYGVRRPKSSPVREMISGCDVHFKLDGGPNSSAEIAAVVRRRVLA